MIIMESVLNVACNSDAELVKCINKNGSTGDNVAKVGDVIVVAVQKVKPNSKIKKGDKQYAVIVRTKGRIKRGDGSSVTFSDNAVVLIDKQGEPIGTRIFGPVTRELRNAGYMKIISLAPEVL